MATESLEVVHEYAWNPRAAEFAETFGLSRDDVEAIADRPARVTADPSSKTRQWPTERCHRGDVTVIVTRPPGRPPLIWGVYLRLPMDSKPEQSASGQGSGTRAPNSLRGLRQRVVQAGLKIEPGGRHDRIVTETGEFVASMPCSPSDQRSVPNLWSTLRRKGYEV